MTKELENQIYEALFDVVALHCRNASKKYPSLSKEIQAVNQYYDKFLRGIKEGDDDVIIIITNPKKHSLPPPPVKKDVAPLQQVAPPPPPPRLQQGAPRQENVPPPQQGAPRQRDVAAQQQQVVPPPALRHPPRQMDVAPQQQDDEDEEYFMSEEEDSRELEEEEAQLDGFVVDDSAPLGKPRTIEEARAYDRESLRTMENTVAVELKSRARKREEEPLGEFDHYNNDQIHEDAEPTGNVLTDIPALPIEIRAELRVACRGNLKKFFETTTIGRKLYGGGIQELAGQTGQGNKNVIAFFDSFFSTVDRQITTIHAAYHKCSACDTGKSCTYYLASKRLYFGSHCADVLKALNMLIDAIEAGAAEEDLNMMRTHLHVIDAAHTQVLITHQNKNKKRFRRS